MRKQSVFADKEKFIEAAESTSSIKEFLNFLGLRAAGGNYKSARNWSARHSIPLPKSYRRGAVRRVADGLVFCENSLFTSRYQIKKRLLDAGWDYSCSSLLCTVANDWLGRPISLHLDHINGVFNDNRIENLRFLCPNCHTQTETFAGRKNRGPKIDKRKIYRPRPDRRKIDWPDVEEVQQMVKNHGYAGSGRRLSVTDNAVRKYIKNNT